MRLKLDVDPDIVAMMAAEVETGERAVTTAMREARAGLKTARRGQIVGAGLPFRRSHLNVRFAARSRSATKQRLAGSISRGRALSARSCNSALRSPGGLLPGVAGRNDEIRPAMWQPTAGGKAVGLVEVPTIGLPHLSEAQKRALRIDDTKLASAPDGTLTLEARASEPTTHSAEFTLRCGDQTHQGFRRMIELLADCGRHGETLAGHWHRGLRILSRDRPEKCSTAWSARFSDLSEAEYFRRLRNQ